MVEANIISRMVHNMMDNGEKIKWKEEEVYLMLKVNSFIKVIG
jgi:hypothetical protein